MSTGIHIDLKKWGIALLIERDGQFGDFSIDLTIGPVHAYLDIHRAH